MKSQQFNKFFLPKTEKNVEKILILGKKSPYDSYHTKFSKRESTKPLSIKILLIPFTEGMGEMSHKQQNLICSFAKWPSCRVTVRLNCMLYSTILLLLSYRLTVETSLIWIAVLRKQVDFLTVYLSCMRHLHINYFFPTFVILAAYVCHYFQSTLSTKGNELFNNSIEMKYSGDNFEAV